MMKTATMLAACILLLAQGGALAHEGEMYGKKHHDARMDKLHRIMPMYAEAQTKINGALEKGDATTVEAEARKIAETVPALKKAKPHKNLKKIDTFKKIADAFGSKVMATVALAKKGDITGAKTAFKKAEEKCNECHATFRD
ncbi:cytochrome c [Geobacter grbiciae]|uniref:cytochrome c n=1 Tax=Geobacter grbiciae TaxID=155042 RepID=UPI001C02D46F|nr:cytochrome c [Geobacter grbiciae]MBT1075816.1 cytochrome c [Geobacter grbiciae]